mmetsp:Transcript_43241/g.112252  ORF Transcript_43241/g.112252 Transcript_43241/m.112252 type:complete len:97 (+) Transcript_43241:3592-3882(+)
MLPNAQRVDALHVGDYGAHSVGSREGSVSILPGSSVVASLDEFSLFLRELAFGTRYFGGIFLFDRNSAFHVGGGSFGGSRGADETASPRLVCPRLR